MPLGVSFVFTLDLVKQSKHTLPIVSSIYQHFIALKSTDNAIICNLLYTLVASNILTHDGRDIQVL